VLINPKGKPMNFQDYIRYDAVGLAELIRKKEVSADEVLQAALNRLDEVNPKLNLLAHDLRERAAAWQGSSENADTQLAGVPFLLKDLLADWEGAPTWSGSRMMQHYIAKQNSDLTQAYLDAGLRVFGKTTTPYATAKLVQPGNTEAIGVHNHHEGCVRYVHTHFNNSGAHQNIYLSAFKRSHYSSFFLGVHTPMQARDSGFLQRRVLF